MDSALRALVSATQGAVRDRRSTMEESRVHVSAAFTAAASLYEWLRNRLEFKEEHLLRRAAIERILQRAMLFGIGNAQARAEEILRELVRSAYFPNDSIPQSRAVELAAILSRYGTLIGHAEGNREKIVSFFIQLASVEIEHLLVPTEKMVEEAFMEFAYSRLRTYVRWENTAPSAEHEPQLFIAIFRTVLHADDPTISWILFRLIRPEFTSLAGQDIPAQVNDLVQAARVVRVQLRNPRYHFYAHAVKQFVPTFTILHDMLVTKTARFAEYTADPVRCTEAALASAKARTEAVGERVGRMAVWATAYVFFTKMLIAFLIELPLELHVTGFRPIPFFINLSIPPLAMFLIAKSTFVPGQENIGKIVTSVQHILYADSSSAPWKAISVLKQRNILQDIIFWVTSCILFGGLGVLLTRFLFSIGYSGLNTAIFFFFVATVSFFAWRIRQPARDISIITPRENVLSAVADTILFPFLFVGRIISDGLTMANIPLMIFDLAIEAPIKVMMNFLEDWTRFLKEKREELIE